MQQNQIPIIENLELFTNLKFLDLSDNLLEFISGLETLFSLRVLVLARNRYVNLSVNFFYFNIFIIEIIH